MLVNCATLAILSVGVFSTIQPVLTSREKETELRDCYDVMKADNTTKFSHWGTYVVNFGQGDVVVLCDMTTDGGGWTVFQRRVDGSTNFSRTYAEYEEGFGQAALNHHMGLKNLHLMTKQKNYELRVVMRGCYNETGIARYSSFYVGNATDKYRLSLGAFLGGNAGDSLSFHNGMAFSTFDRDQDTHQDTNCAQKWIGAFWYNNCYHANPNGPYSDYYECRLAILWQGIVWKTWTTGHFAVKSTKMMLRPVLTQPHEVNITRDF